MSQETRYGVCQAGRGKRPDGSFDEKEKAAIVPITLWGGHTRHNSWPVRDFRTEGLDSDREVSEGWLQ
jgi:hypothetical protein